MTVHAGDTIPITYTFNPMLAQQLPTLRKVQPHFVTGGDSLSDVMCIGLAWTSKVCNTERTGRMVHHPAISGHGATKSGSGSKNWIANASRLTAYSVHSRNSPPGPVGRSRWRASGTTR